MIPLFVLAISAAVSSASSEAEALGVRLARTGTLAALLPMMIEKDTKDLVADQKGLSDADKAQLLVITAVKSREGIARVMALEGKAYASALSLHDLRALVTFNETAVAARFRAAQPKIIGATIQGLAGMDFKKEVLEAFCKQTGKACSAK